VQWNTSRTTDANRKAVVKELEQMASAGLLTTRHRKQTRNLYARLSDQAEALTRALCGLPGLPETIDAMGLLLAKSRRHVDTVSGRWASERQLAGVGKGALDTVEARRPLVAMEETLLPAMCRGWVRGESDSSRRVDYCLTPEGRAVLRRKPQFDVATEAPVEDARQLYYRRVNEALDRLGTATPETVGETGILPLIPGMTISQRDFDRMENATA
jgi:DNA-binding PadR family transcriptional regulator